MKIASLELTHILIKYKDQQQQILGGGMLERMYPVSAVIDIVKEHTDQHTAPLIEALEELISVIKSLDGFSNNPTNRLNMHATKAEAALLTAKGL